MRAVSLLGGETLLLSPLTPACGAHLAAGVAALSPSSAYLRFHSPRPRLDGREIAYLTDVDQHDRAAWVLSRGRTGVALGRYVRLEGAPDTAEVALTVLDGWQGRGLSKLLIAALMRTARQAGIARLAASVLDGNHAALHLLASLGGVPERAGDGTWSGAVGTDPGALPPTPAAEAVRHYDRLLAAAGRARHPPATDRGGPAVSV